MKKALEKIEVEIAGDSLGYNSDNQNEDFVDAVQSALEDDYPDADIDVYIGLTSSVLASTSDGHEFLGDDYPHITESEKIDDTVQRIWDGANY